SVHGKLVVLRAGQRIGLASHLRRPSGWPGGSEWRRLKLDERLSSGPAPGSEVPGRIAARPRPVLRNAGCRGRQLGCPPVSGGDQSAASGGTGRGPVARGAGGEL